MIEAALTVTRAKQNGPSRAILFSRQVFRARGWGHFFSF